jgi:hypothetical protein
VHLFSHLHRTREPCGGPTRQAAAPGGLPRMRRRGLRSPTTPPRLLSRAVRAWVTVRGRPRRAALCCGEQRVSVAARAVSPSAASGRRAHHAAVATRAVRYAAPPGCASGPASSAVCSSLPHHPHNLESSARCVGPRHPTFTYPPLPNTSPGGQHTHRDGNTISQSLGFFSGGRGVDDKQAPSTDSI